MSAALTFYCSGENAAFSLKDLVVREVEPVSESGRKLYLTGKECEAIYWAPGDTGKRLRCSGSPCSGQAENSSP